MRLLSIFFFFTGMSLHCVTAGAQWVVTDPGNTAQGIINAANTASTVKQTVEQVNRLQTALDYVQKVSATVRRARMFTDLIDRQNRLNSNCLRTLEEAEKMDMKELPGITSAVQDVVANNAAIISLTCLFRKSVARRLHWAPSDRSCHIRVPSDGIWDL